jgi:hypothetical protein
MCALSINYGLITQRESRLRATYCKQGDDRLMLNCNSSKGVVLYLLRAMPLARSAGETGPVEAAQVVLG